MELEDEDAFDEEECGPAGPGLEPLLTPKQVAEALAVKVSWVYQAAREGTIPCVYAGRWVRFQRDAVTAWIEAGGGGRH